MPAIGFFHACVGYPDAECHCFHPYAYINERPFPDHDCPKPVPVTDPDGYYRPKPYIKSDPYEPRPASRFDE